MFKQLGKQLAAFGVVFILSANRSDADVVSDFSTTAESWTVVSFGNLPADNYTVLGIYPAGWNAGGGNPGGYISSTDPDSGDFTFAAPSAFLGNDSAATGLSYDLTHPQGAIDYQTTDVVLTGNATQLLWKSNPDIVPGAGWTSVGLSFTPSANWHVNTTGGPLATVADFQNVLGNLSGLFIRGEYTAGGELAGIDNIRLIGVPEPTTFVMASLGLLGLGWVALRRKVRRV